MLLLNKEVLKMNKVKAKILKEDIIVPVVAIDYIKNTVSIDYSSGELWEYPFSEVSIIYSSKMYDVNNNEIFIGDNVFIHIKDSEINCMIKGTVYENYILIKTDSLGEIKFPYDYKTFTSKAFIKKI